MSATQFGSVISKRKRLGRWTSFEADLFEELIDKYGKNWKKIQSFIKGRTLCQIRSHAQKFFERVGPSKVQEYERKAKLLQAIQTLEKEKQFQEEVVRRQQLGPVHQILKTEEILSSDMENPSKSSEIRNEERELINLEFISEQLNLPSERQPQAPLQNLQQQASTVIEQRKQCLYTPIYWFSNALPSNNFGVQYQGYNQRYGYQLNN